MTNAVTFALGAATDLPGLYSFCVYASVGAPTSAAPLHSPLHLTYTAPAPSPHRLIRFPWLQVGTITDLLCQLSLFVACMVRYTP